MNDSIALIIGLVFWITLTGVCIWVYKDAKSLGVEQKPKVKGESIMDRISNAFGPFMWAFVCYITWGIFLLLYFPVRKRYMKKNTG
jgi:hypothetical protein